MFKSASGKTWSGEVDNCQLCNQPITTEFIDGKTVMGPWAIMCRACHSQYGCGLGTGRGQLYELVLPVTTAMGDI